MGFERYRYVVAESREIGAQVVLSRRLLGRHLVVFRNADGKPVILQDRCLHRCGKLSMGRIVGQGKLQCPYHGWLYDGEGTVVSIPSEGGEKAARKRRLRSQPIASREQDGFVFACLKPADSKMEPFAMPHFAERGWRHVRLRNCFGNTVTNCVENFIDIPHTIFVHPKIFRRSENRPLTARVRRRGDVVEVDYEGEERNLGTFSWFLNPRRLRVEHRDSFFAPNVTHVRYDIGGKTLFITSHSVPLDDEETLVYTDLTWRFGFWTPFVGWLVRRQARKVINQDIRVLNDQMDVLRSSGRQFIDTPADRIHTLVTEIREAIEADRDPSELPEREFAVEFYV